MPQFDVYYTVCERYHAVIEADSADDAISFIHTDGMFEGSGDSDYFVDGTVTEAEEHHEG